MSNMTANQIAKLLAERAESVAMHLLPNGKREGHEWRVGSVDGNPGKSLGVHLTGDKAGVWCDFESGEGGDLLTLWSLTRNLNLSAAMQDAKKFLGLHSPSFTPHHAYPWEKPKFENAVSVEKHPKAFAYLTQQRKISAITLQKFKLLARGHEIIFPFFRNDERVFAKFLGIDRVDGKKTMHVSKNCEPILFGWQASDLNARSVVLCEGEIDALSLHDYGFNALSLPLGAGKGSKHQWLENEFENLSVFDEIYLCFDNDEPGRQTAMELLPRLGQHRCKIVTLPHKDANECLQKNVSHEDMQACFDVAAIVDPQELKQAYLFCDLVIEEFYPTSKTALGFSPPFQKAQGKIFFGTSELSIWNGINGQGKSQFLGQVMLSCMKQDARVCVASLELRPQKLLMRLTRQAAGLREPTVEYIRAVHQWYRDKLWIFDLLGTAKTEKLLEIFLYARQRYNIQVFVIDSLMKCGIAEDDYKNQKAFVEQLCDFKNQYPCHIHLVTHPRKGVDEDEIPGKLDVKGTGAITDLADNCFSIWRNKAKENEIQRNIANNLPCSPELLEKIDCLWGCDKQRNGEWEGKIGLWFDKESFRFLERFNQKVLPYVNYSRLDSNEIDY